MGYSTPDAYYQPEAFGLTIIGEIGEYGLSYEFDDLIVWQHENGTLYWAKDYGCSCPAPFEWATSLEELNVLNRDTFGEFEANVNDYNAPAAERSELLRKADGYLRLEEAGRIEEKMWSTE